jgi:hypothetical protein
VKQRNNFIKGIFVNPFVCCSVLFITTNSQLKNMSCQDEGIIHVYHIEVNTDDEYTLRPRQEREID